jgi:bifunctional DNA-binding transcriptional regulator/antitoxin component of YhaV-PrlF toxin-antitoxin module
MFLVERLESLITNGRKLPGTKSVIIDRDSALGFIDELRVTIPEEVRAAKRINAEGERIVERAEEQAERIVARAQEQAAFLIDEQGLTQAAEEQARQLLAVAESDAGDTRRGADDYAISVLASLEDEVAKQLQAIKRGIELLDRRRSGARAEPSPIDQHDEAGGDYGDYEESPRQIARP